MLVIITGVAGFIGSNLAEHLLKAGHEVVGIDNLSRKGSDANLDRLEVLGRKCGTDAFRCYYFDVGQTFTSSVRTFTSSVSPYEHADAVFHLAGQVAVTRSIIDPREDFESNALGTFNVLEAVRQNNMKAVVVYASTNKVYGEMRSSNIVGVGYGVHEGYPLDFHSPYGCSKGAGDQYMVDYARTYGLRTVTFRQSCIYGPHQFGIEDQGWVAWFTIAAMLGKPITIYGDGHQVRDVLWVEDLIEAYMRIALPMAPEPPPMVPPGSVYNIGGGSKNTLSLLSLIAMLEKRLGKNIPVKFEPPRQGDQKVYVSDIRKAERELGWRPKVGVEEGIERMVQWVEENLDLVKEVVG